MFYNNNIYYFETSKTETVMSEDGVYTQTNNGIRINVDPYLKQSEEAILESIKGGWTSDTDFSKEMRLTRLSVEHFNSAQENREKKIQKWEEEKKNLQFAVQKIESELYALHSEVLNCATPQEYNYQISNCEELYNKYNRELEEVTLKILKWS